MWAEVRRAQGQDGLNDCQLQSNSELRLDDKLVPNITLM